MGVKGKSALFKLFPLALKDLNLQPLSSLSPKILVLKVQTVKVLTPEDPDPEDLDPEDLDPKFQNLKTLKP